jgi:GT2 family glycosyltransferase
MKVGYICTNYNGTSDTLKALRGLLADGGDDVRSVVVDNCSIEDERQRLMTSLAGDGRVNVLLSEKNLGYFGGLNAGIARMRELWPDCHLLVVGNNDLEFPAGFCAAVQALKGKLERFPVISPRVRTLDGREQNPHVVHSVSLPRERLYDLYYSTYAVAVILRLAGKIVTGRWRRGDEDGYESEQFIRQGHGSCYIIGPAFLREFGSLWAPTFLFGEEFFLSHQLEERGYQVLYDPSVQVIHACHATVSALPSRRHWELSREAHLLYRKYYPISAVKKRRQELRG